MHNLALSHADAKGVDSPGIPPEFRKLRYFWPPESIPCSGKAGNAKGKLKKEAKERAFVPGLHTYDVLC